MSWLPRSFLPRTLLLRTFLLLTILMLISVLAWFAIFSSYEREPRARQLTQLLVSVVNLTRAALISAEPGKRQDLLGELSEREGIRIYPADDGDIIEPLPDLPVLLMAQERLRAELGPATRLALQRNGEAALFVSFRIEDDDEYWVALPRERIERTIPWQWLGWGAAALLLSLAGAWLIMFRVTRPLKAFAAAAREIGRGLTPAPVAENGPEEMATLARTFNQMSRDLARLDADRALILAGISHDLRTPLARLRMGIEMSGADALTREGMEVDVEEMDKTIGQFLDFARADGGEALQEVDIAGLLEEMADQYRRRGYNTATNFAAAPPAAPITNPIQLRPQALRRAVGNLIENALRYAGDDKPVTLTLSGARGEICIDIADRGPGIPAAEADRLKLPFTRLETARSNAGGAGLGLAIVDRIVRSHGGRFDLLPRDGGGLIARITLPAKPS
jgi:two-component system osmolarity sensor histidine kinase EnvZ